jgi:hypothetical protein
MAAYRAEEGVGALLSVQLDRDVPDTRLPWLPAEALNLERHEPLSRDERQDPARLSDKFKAAGGPLASERARRSPRVRRSSLTRLRMLPSSMAAS